MSENRSGYDRRGVSNRRCTHMDWKRKERRGAAKSETGRRSASRRQGY